MTHRLLTLLLLFLMAHACANASPSDAHADNVKAPPVASLVEGEGPVAGGSAPRLAAGPAKLGCLAWSAQRHAAACVTGWFGMPGASMALVFVGGSLPAQRIAEAKRFLFEPPTLDRDVVSRANAQLAAGAFAALPGAPVRLPPRRRTQVGGVTLVFDERVSPPARDKVAPMQGAALVATCDGRRVELFRKDARGLDVRAQARAVDGHVLVELNVDIVREDDASYGFEVVLLDAATCKVSRPSEVARAQP